MVLCIFGVIAHQHQDLLAHHFLTFMVNDVLDIARVAQMSEIKSPSEHGQNKQSDLSNSLPT